MTATDKSFRRSGRRLARVTAPAALAVVLSASLLSIPASAYAAPVGGPTGEAAAQQAGAGASGADKPHDRRTVVDVADFGADPTGRRDSAAGIRAAIAHAKTLDGPTRIYFSPGTYQIWPEQTAKRELYVSNTSGTNQAVKTKNIGILIEDMDDVVVDGGGSKLVYHGFQTIFATIRSTDVRFTDFSQDWVAPKTVDITVAESGVADGRAYRTIAIPDTYRYAIDGTSIRWSGELSPTTGTPYWTGSNSFNYSQVHDPEANKTWRTSNPVFRNVADIVDLGDRRVRITYNDATRPTDEGYVYQMRETTRDTPGGLFWESKDITVDHLDLGYLHGFGLVGQFSENITIDSVKFMADRDTGRVTSAFADHIQMSGVKGRVRISRNVFDNPQDDPINVHGTYLQVTSAAAKTLKLRYMHHETAGFPQFHPGDQVELVDKRTMLAVPGATATVVSADGPSGEAVPPGEDPQTYLRDMTVVLDAPLPASVAANPQNFVAENITYTPSVEIVGNTFQAVPTRGVLVTTRKPVLIEGNRFDGMSMASIYISSDAYQWFESGPVRDVVIRNNVFARPSGPVIWFDPTNREVVPGEPVHRNVLIEDNTFDMVGGTLVAGRSVGDLTFRSNHVRRYAWVKLQGGDERMRIGDTARLTAQTLPAQYTAPLFTFDGADDITIARNDYEDGFNKRINTRNMDPTEVTVVGEDLALNGDNQTSGPVKITYSSSNRKVARVDADGVVTAVGSGKAQIRAHVTVGGRKIVSDPVPIRVTGKAIGH
ncbi:glycosyl hydrolase family 28-related protein [Streptomyces sp. NPDC058534]|uniref:glycosyl hydrolase family 28-related protein n=1 Tax=Streptomyces sp. NPDC058534 TaxID=3346541 RepID=UPI003646EA72